VDTSRIDKDNHRVHPSERELTEATLREGHVKVCALVHATKRSRRLSDEVRARIEQGGGRAEARGSLAAGERGPSLAAI
jgi:hypothetical protein